MSDFNDAHRCVHCGARYDEHALAGNPHCPEHRCPGNTTFPRCTGGDESAWDAAIARHWTARATTFRGTL